MPKPKGHKEGCQCAICRKVDTNIQDKLFELFNQGHRVGSSKIQVIEPNSKVLKVYFANWATLKALEPRIIADKSNKSSTAYVVPLNTLVVGQEFESNGALYRIKPNGKCVFLETPAGMKVEKYIVTIPGDTLVKTN